MLENLEGNRKRINFANEIQRDLVLLDILTYDMRD